MTILRGTSTTVGTGTYATGTAFTGYITSGATVSYQAIDRVTGRWETGKGVWTTGGSLTRSQIISTSSGTASAISWAAGTRDITVNVSSGEVGTPGGTSGTGATTAALDAEIAARAAAVANTAALIAAHTNTIGNPHGTTPAQIGAYTQAQVDAKDAIAAAQAAAAATAAATAATTANTVKTDLAAMKQTGGLLIPADGNIPDYASDAAAQAAGLKVGQIYRTGSILKVLSTTVVPSAPTPTRTPVFSNNISSAVLGATTSVNLGGLLANEAFTWTVVKNDPPTYTWRTTPMTSGTASSIGTAVIPAGFVATGDFLKVKFTNPVQEVNSTQVLTTNIGSNAGTSSSSVRGRPKLLNGTVVTDLNSRIRGATMGLDEIGSVASVYAKDRANWTKMRNLGLNLIRVPFSLSLAGVSLSAQLVEMDVIVANAAATGMYVMFLFDSNYGTSLWSEMLSSWPVIAARYKDATHVLFEMQNEPHFNSSEHTSAELDSIAQIHTAMRAAAPSTMIGVLCPASLENGDGSNIGTSNGAGIIAAANGLKTRAVDIGTNSFVAFHDYGYYSRASVSALKAAHPCMLTETTSGGPNNHANPQNEVFIVSEMETVGVSWIILSPRFGEVNNVDTPYSNDEETLTTRVLPGIHTAGFNWTADPIASTPVPPTTGGPAITSLTGAVGQAVVGSPVTMQVTATGTPTVNWVIADTNWVWRSDGSAQVTLTNGVGTFAWTPVAAGDRVKVWPTAAPGSNVDSIQVPAQSVGNAGTGNVGAPIARNANTYMEDFSNNTGGTLNHTWGNKSAISYTNGILRIAAVPGSPGDSGAAGVMHFPGGANQGFGYGFYEFRVRFFGSGPGPCILLWAADDSWPRAEEDMGELTDVWYCAHHYDNGAGSANPNVNNSYEIFTYKKTTAPTRPDLPRGQWVMVGCYITPGRLEYFVDVGNGYVSIGFTTNHVTPMYSDGGVNRVMGVMHRGDLLDTAVEVDYLCHTPA